MSYKRVTAAALTLLLAMSITACNTGTTTEKENTTATETEASSERVYSEEEMFTKRDKKADYDESSAVEIACEDSKITCDSKEVTISDNQAVITEEGTYVISGTLTNGQIVVDVDKSEKVQLVLNGVNINCDTSAAIYVKQADKVFITLAEGSENVLSTKEEYVAIDDNNIDAVIFSKEDLTLNGTGSLTIQAAYGHGIVSKDDLAITGGTYEIQAEKHALCGKDSVRIADGTFHLACGKDAVHAKNTDDESLGFVYIAGGTFEIESEDDGMHASQDMVIQGGTIHINHCYEGIEGRTIDIADGDITICAEDDGLNAANGSSTDSEDTDGTQQKDMQGGGMDATDESCYIKIEGGTLRIDASGDGIDSNGSLYVTGGETYVSGAENDGDGAIDYNGEATITGGTFVAAGMSGMAQNFGEDSTQGTMLVNLTGSRVQGELLLKDSEGNTILSYTPEKSYNSVVISHPGIQKDQTYTVEAGGQSTEVEMTAFVYGEGGMGAGGPQMAPGAAGENTAPPENADKTGENTPPDGGGQDAKQGTTPPEKPDGMKGGGTPPEKPQTENSSEM